MKKKYIEWRINVIEIQARQKFGEWEPVASWTGKSIITATTSVGLLSKLRYWIKNVVDPKMP